MRIAYFDLIAGASGDMLLGALVDAGLPFAKLQCGLAALHLPGFELTCAKVMRGAFAASKVDVHTDDHAPARYLPEIEAIINASSLPPTIQAASLRIFRRMIAVEAGIHNAPPESVHLHELGALDTIVDVTGVLLGLELLGVERVVCSPVPLGRGTLTGSHGRMPLPAPATIALLAGAPVVGVDHALETVTPTAAALITELASAYGPIPAMHLQGVGYGAGTRTTPEPNILRALLGEAAASAGLTGEPLDLLETNIDDMNPEIYGYMVERLLAAGALDAYLTPVIMKKNRPAVEVGVLCRPEDTARLRDLLFAETTTLGIRTQQVARHCLPRTSEQVETPFGRIRVKISRWGPDLQKAAPEYEDCRAAAQMHGVPLRTVYEAALVAWHGQSQDLARQEAHSDA
jgi:uncharacterized protein (TIGR00299 family) protein